MMYLFNVNPKQSGYYHSYTLYELQIAETTFIFVNKHLALKRINLTPRALFFEI